MSLPDTSGLEQRIGYTFTNLDLLEEALTHKSYHYENIDVSIGHNERLEFLGDSVLALTVVDNIFRRERKMNEAEMSKVRSFVVKGVVLSEIAAKLELGNLLLLGHGENESGGRQKQSILANALEALIGAVYIDGGRASASELVMRLVGDKLNDVVESGDYHDYKSDLQEACQTRFGQRPEYHVIKQVGEDHDKLYTIDVVIEGETYGTGTGQNKKTAQTEAARVALLKLFK